MITKEMILSGIAAGVVKLIDSPHDKEPSCRIGEHWFYYAGSEGSGLTSSEYTSKVPLDEIAGEIVSALDGIREDLDGTDEYGYYEAVLRDAGITDDDRIQSDFINEVMASCGGDREKAHEFFKLWWMLKHGYTLTDLIGELANLQYGDPEDSDRISTPVSDIFREWEADIGFGGEIWPSLAEFLDCEYREVGK